MKVLFVNPIGQLGGAERALLDLISSLRHSSPELQASVLSFTPGPLLDEAAVLGAAISTFPLPESVTQLGDSGGFSALRSVLALARAAAWAPMLSRRLSAEGPDIIHTNGLKAHALVAVARPAGIPLVWHLHDFISHRRLMRRLLPALRSRAATAIAVSEAVAKDARQLLRGLPVVTVLNGIQTREFSRSTIAPADLDSLAGLPPAPTGTARVGLVATLATWKGHEVFLEAAQRLRSRRARFYLVGGGLYSTVGSQRTIDELHRMIARLHLGEQAGVVPFQRDIAPIFAALDIVVNASTKPEPFGRVVAEGMSAGRAVVAVGAGGILEQIEDGKTGLLFPIGDPQTLSDQLDQLLLSPALRNELGNAAARHAAEHLDARRLGPEIHRIYARLERGTAPPNR